MNHERVFADTSIFLRYLTNDMPAQADGVQRLLQQAAAGEVILVTNTLVISEIVWTLDSYYRLTRDDIRTKILAILNTPGLDVPERDLLFRAIAEWHELNVDFVDAYNAAWLLAHEMTDAYTFDRKHYSRLGGIRVRIPGQDVSADAA